MTHRQTTKNRPCTMCKMKVVKATPNLLVSPKYELHLIEISSKGSNEGKVSTRASCLPSLSCRKYDRILLSASFSPPRFNFNADQNGTEMTPKTLTMGSSRKSERPARATRNNRSRKRTLKKFMPWTQISAVRKIGTKPIIAQLLVIARPKTNPARINHDSRWSSRNSSKQ